MIKKKLLSLPNPQASRMKSNRSNKKPLSQPTIVPNTPESQLILHTSFLIFFGLLVLLESSLIMID
jgi:hypothetical protein